MGQYDQSVGIKQNALWVTIFKTFCDEAFSFAGFEANEPFKSPTNGGRSLNKICGFFWKGEAQIIANVSGTVRGISSVLPDNFWLGWAYLLERCSVSV